jgi:hypothetical protein
VVGYDRFVGEDIVRDILREYVQVWVSASAQSSSGPINQELEQRILSGLSAPGERPEERANRTTH